MPGRMEFEFELGSARKGRPRDDGTPMRLLLLGDFSGKPAAERPPLATRPTHKVDVDTLDAVMQRIGPRLQIGADEIALRSIDDFHPDGIFRRATVFEALRRTRTNPPSSSVAVAEDLGRLLGKPAEAAAAPKAPAGSIEAMIHDIVAPHIVKGAAADTKSYLAAVDASITAEEWMPGAKGWSGKNNGNALAKATRAFGTRIKTFFDEVNSPSTRIAAAALASAHAK